MNTYTHSKAGEAAVRGPVSNAQHQGGKRRTEIHTPNNTACTAFSNSLLPSLPLSLLFMLTRQSSTQDITHDGHPHMTTIHFSVLTYSQYISVHMCSLHSL